MQGEYQDAYDVLDSVNSNSTQEFHRAVVCGFLRHAQVCEVSYIQQTMNGVLPVSLAKSLRHISSFKAVKSLS